MLDNRQDGLGGELWRGSERATVARLIADLPAPLRSPALHDLARRVLLTAAAAPAGAWEGDTLATLRIGRLMALGDAPSATRLLAQTAAGERPEALARVELEALLLVHDNAGACAATRSGFARQPSPDWHKALVYCRILSGDQGAAQLGVDLIREQGHVDRPFFTLVDILTGQGDTGLASLASPSALHLAMLRVANKPVPADAVPSAGPAHLATIARSPNATIAVRLDAAERALSINAVAPGLARQLYGTPEAALRPPNDERGGRARLYQRAMAEASPATRAGLIADLLAQLEQAGHIQAARVAAPLLAELTPTPELADFAPRALRAALAAGLADDAGRWFAVLGTPEARATAAALLQLSSPARAPAWPAGAIAAMERAHGPAYRRRLVTFAALAEGLGDTLPPEARLALGGDLGPTAALPAPGIWFGLATAPGAGRKGETVLYVVSALGQMEAKNWSPVVLHAAIRALKTIGLESEARQLAVEAALAGGL